MLARHRLIPAAAGALLVALTIAGVVAAGAGPRSASAELVDAAGTPVGWARLVEDADGTVHVNVHVAGLTPGLHGIHIHAVAACTLGTTPTFSSAGGHHNPLAVQHGLDNPLGSHAGDLPNLVVNGAGLGHLDATTTLATITAGPRTIFDLNGSALIVHAAVDDQVTDPTGNSGARIACGVLTGD